MVDGLGIGDVGRIVLRDRKKMAEEGMLVAIIPLDVHSGKIADNIEIISRGFVYVKKSKELINKAKQEIRNSIKGTKTPITEWNSLKEKIKDNLEKLLYKELERLPMVIPIIIRV
jgi:ribonuclease J